jgi:hypothetical protein
MKKYLVCSDIHQEKAFFESLISQYNHSLSGIIFAGDGLPLLYHYPTSNPIFAVKGNMDHNFPYPHLHLDFKLDQISIFLTHGHHYEVKKNLDFLKAKTVSQSYDLVIFGHTHLFHYEKYEKTIYFNPGSLMNGKYSLLWLEEEAFALDHYTL